MEYCNKVIKEAGLKLNDVGVLKALEKIYISTLGDIKDIAVTFDDILKANSTLDETIPIKQCLINLHNAGFIVIVEMIDNFLIYRMGDRMRDLYFYVEVVNDNGEIERLTPTEADKKYGRS